MQKYIMNGITFTKMNYCLTIDDSVFLSHRSIYINIRLIIDTKMALCK